MDPEIIHEETEMINYSKLNVSLIHMIQNYITCCVLNFMKNCSHTCCIITNKLCMHIIKSGMCINILGYGLIN